LNKWCRWRQFNSFPFPSRYIDSTFNFEVSFKNELHKRTNFDNPKSTSWSAKPHNLLRPRIVKGFHHNRKIVATEI
jgi:hypothetical protein